MGIRERCGMGPMLYVPGSEARPYGPRPAEAAGREASQTFQLLEVPARPAGEMPAKGISKGGSSYAAVAAQRDSMKNFLFSLVRGLVSFLLSLPRPLAIAIAVVVVAFIGTGAYGAYAVYNYTENNPNFCRSCHIMDNAWDKWAASAHSKVNCHECHQVSVFESMDQVIMYAIDKPDKVTSHAVVNPEACQKCHESGDPQWEQVADTAGHSVHAGEQNISCLTCHAVTLHSFSPPEKICLACHPDKDMTYSAMGQRYCLDCHNFLAVNSPLLPQNADCLKCHQQQIDAEVHLTSDSDTPMQFQCSQCHQPHTNQDPADACITCHSDIKQQGLHSDATHSSASCVTCHKEHAWKVTDRSTCLICHQDKADHNPDQFCGDCHSFSGT
jgi:nitrate/TMAO reductase-like tetraheme cytochrome c subunit